MRRSRIALAVGLPTAAAGASWLATRELDRRRIERDPEYARINAPLRGRPLTVTASDGTGLHAEVFGPEGAPTLVLTHGWTCTLSFWTYQIQALSDRFRIVAWDLRGHGRSERPRDRDYSIDAFGDDLEAVLEATLADGERAVLAGHSMGGMTIVAWAGRHPEEVERRAAAVALVSTGVGDLISEALVVRTPARFRSGGERITQLLLSSPLPVPRSPAPLVYRAVRYLALSRAASPAQVDFAERMTIDARRDVRAASAATLSRLDLNRSVASVTAPTLLMVGENDRLTPPPHARRLEEALPEPAELVEIPRFGHMLPLEAPDDVTAGLHGLVERHLLSSSSPVTASPASTGSDPSPSRASRTSA